MKRVLQVLFPSITLLMATPAMALHEVYSPDVEKGEWELEYRADRFGDNEPLKNNTQEHEVELGYSLTDSLRVELSVEGERESERPFYVSAYGIKGIYQTPTKATAGGFPLAHCWGMNTNHVMAAPTKANWRYCLSASKAISTLS